MVRERDAEHRGGQHDPAIGPGAQARVVGRLAPVADEPLPAEQQPDDRDEQDRVERVGVRRDADPPHQRREREPDRRRDARPGSATPSRRLTSTVRPAAEAISSADRRFIRNAGDPSGAEDGRHEPAEHARRPGTRSGASCPGSAGPSGPRPCPRRRGRAGAWTGRRRTPRHRSRAPPGTRGRSGGAAGRRRYQPRSWPQATPHRLMAAPAITSATAMPRGRPSAWPAPSATSGSRNGMKSSENR